MNKLSRTSLDPCENGAVRIDGNTFALLSLKHSVYERKLLQRRNFCSRKTEMSDDKHIQIQNITVWKVKPNSTAYYHERSGQLNLLKERTDVGKA